MSIVAKVTVAHLSYSALVQTVARKRFAICCWTVVSAVHVCDVGVLWPNGWMDQDAIS